MFFFLQKIAESPTDETVNITNDANDVEAASVPTTNGAVAPEEEEKIDNKEEAKNTDDVSHNSGDSNSNTPGMWYRPRAENFL